METVESGNQRQVLDLDQEDALKGCKEVEKFESQGVFSVDLGNEEPNREILQSRILEEPKKSMRIEVQMEERVMDSTQEVAKSCKSVGKFESQRVLSVDLENEEQDREALYRGVMLMEPRRKSTRGEVSEEQKVKRLTLKKSITRAMTSQGGRKLVDSIESNSGALVDDIQSPGEVEETVVLRGTAKAVEKAGQLLDELRGVLRESVEFTKCGVAVEKKLTFKKSFTRALTDMGGKLVKDIRKDNEAIVEVIPSPGRAEETVVLKGTSESVGKAEQMLMALCSSAQEISLSSEEREALLTGGRRCILTMIRLKLQVALYLQGQKLLLFGKPSDTKEAKEIIEEELRLVRKILSGK